MKTGGRGGALLEHPKSSIKRIFFISRSSLFFFFLLVDAKGFVGKAIFVGRETRVGGAGM